MINLKRFIFLTNLIFVLASNVYDDNDIIYILCESDENGVFLPHPYECNKYFECVGSPTGILMKCPEGLVFDPLFHICDWPWNVDCTDKPYPKDCCNVGKVQINLEYMYQVLKG